MGKPKKDFCFISTKKVCIAWKFIIHRIQT